jgi:hypothetical protein
MTTIADLEEAARAYLKGPMSDARYIAAADPLTVLRLIERLRKAEEVAEAAKALEPCRNCDDTSNEWNGLRRALNALAGIEQGGRE